MLDLFQRVRCEVWPPLFCCERDSDSPFPCVCPGLLLRRRLQVPFPTGDLLVAGADLFLLSFALQGWLCAFIGFKVPRTFRGASFCSSCQAFGVLQCSGRRIFSGHRFSCWWWRMVLSLFFFVDGMVDVLSVASVRRGSATRRLLRHIQGFGVPWRGGRRTCLDSGGMESPAFKKMEISGCVGLIIL